MSRKEDIKKLIIKQNRRLQILKEQQATFGISADPRIFIEIEDIEAELEKLQAELMTAFEAADNQSPVPSSSTSSASQKGGTQSGDRPTVRGDVFTGSRVINIGGGAYIEGTVNTGGGDFVGRDQTISITGADLAAMFLDIYRRIEIRPADPNVDRAEVKETVQKIEQEVKKGEEANPAKVERWLKTLKDIAPDIGEVTIACLTNPAAGVAMMIKKIAEKAQG